MMRWAHWLCAGAALAALGCAEAEERLTLVVDGIARCRLEIAEDADPAVRFGAKEIAKYFGLASGCRELSGSVPVRVTVDKTGLKDDGFVLDVTSSGVTVTGANPRGALYGCYEIVKRAAGVRWLVPGEDGEYVPKRLTLSLPVGRVVKNPAMRVREFRGGGMEGYLWYARNFCQSSAGYATIEKNPRLRELAVRSVGNGSGHILSNLLLGWGKRERLKAECDRLFAAHPEYFPLVDGKRRKILSPGDPNPCISNPAVLDIMASNLWIAVKDAHMTERGMTIGNNDTTVWCACEKCRALDASEAAGTKGARSDRYWHLVNELARRVWAKDPTVRLGGWAYQDFWYPPRHVSVDPRLEVLISFNNQCWRHAITDPACEVNAEFRRILAAWKATGHPQVFNRDEISAVGSAGSCYAPVERTLARNVRANPSLGLCGDHFCTDTPFPPFLGWAKKVGPYYGKNYRWLAIWMANYVAAQLMFDATSDAEALWDEAGRLYYGEAAWTGGFRDFRKRLEKAFYSTPGCFGWGQGVSIGKSLDDSETERELVTLLEKAVAAARASGDERALRHVLKDREIFNLTWISARRAYEKGYRDLSARPKSDEIVLDGALDEKDWSEAEVLTGFSCGGSDYADGGTAKVQTRVRFVHAPDTLYAAVECLEPTPGKIVAGEKVDRAIGWGDLGDHVELFVSAPSMGARALHLSVNAKGRVLDGLQISTTERDKTFETKARWAVKTLSDRWILELALPTSDCGSVCCAGDEWRVNVGRCRKVEGEAETSSAVGGAFYAPDSFVHLKLLDATAVRHVPSDLPKNYRFRLAWSDEFDGTELDRRNWDYRRALCGRPWPSWTDKGVRLDGRGHCVFTVVEGTNGLPVSSQLQTGYNFMDTPVERTKFHEDDLQWNIGKLHRNKFLHRYGYWECRCRLQQRPGWWPAFWIQSPTIGASTDPAETGAEIDVMESFRVGEIVPHNAYTAGYGKDANCEDTGFFSTVDPSVYHTFGVLWTEKGYTFYIDGREDGHINRNISKRPQFMLVGTEVNGYRRTCRQPTEEAKKAVGDTFVVDHVRVFDIEPEEDLPLPEGPVVLSDRPDAPERFAAEEFAKWSEQLTGKPRELVFRRLPPQERIVKDDGFRLDVERDRAVVSAKHSFGFVAGVHYVLTRFGGIRWFTPDSGADIPAGVTELRVPRGTLVRNPFRYRAGLTPSSGRAATASVRREIDLWHVRNGFRAVDTALSGGSRPIRASYFKETEVKAGAAAGRKRLDEFRAWKAKNCPDGPATWSLFAIDVPSAEAWWDFVNPLAKEALADPLVHVRVAVLRKCQAWPERESSWPIRDKRLSILFYTHGRCHLHDLDDPLCPHNALIRDRLLKWRRSGLEVNTFEFMNQLAGKCNYAFWERAWVRDLKWYAQQRIANSDGGLVGPWAGMSGKEDTYARNNGAKARWLTAYLTGWFSWDTQDDFETVRNDALRRYYRAAAEPMMRYHDLLENAMLDGGACLTYGGGTAFVAASQVPGVLDKGARLLAEAKRLAAGDAETLRRVQRDAEYFKVEWQDAVPVPAADERRTLPASLQFGDGAVDVRRDDDDLVISCRLPKSADGFKDVADDGSTFAAMKGPHVEFLLFAPTMKGKYWHFAVAHNGLVYSALTENGSSRDLSKRLGFTRRISETETDWTVVCRIPFAALGGTPDYIRLDMTDGKRTVSGKLFHCPLEAVPIVLQKSQQI